MDPSVAAVGFPVSRWADIHHGQELAPEVDDAPDVSGCAGKASRREEGHDLAYRFAVEAVQAPAQLDDQESIGRIRRCPGRIRSHRAGRRS